MADITLNPGVFHNAEFLQRPENLGRLKIRSDRGDADGDGQFEKLYSFGGRSFSILDQNGKMTFDSADLLDRFALYHDEAHYNSEGSAQSFDSRSDDKGIEPEGLTTAVVNHKPYLFLVLERISSILIFDLSYPTFPTLVSYTSNIDEDGAAPEGIQFIPGKNSPNGHDLLLVTYEGIGKIRIFEVNLETAS